MLPDSLIETIKNTIGLSDLLIITEPEWGSTNPLGRINIREFLSQHTGFNLRDLNAIPTIPKLGLSISHHRNRGGFVVSQDTPYLGFDIEINTRVRPELLNRVAISSDELEQAPSVPALWTAKEAAFKCLRNLAQPRGLADIEINDWNRIGQNCFSCSLVSKKHRATGVVIEDPIQGETWSLFRGFNTNKRGYKNALAIN
jgi:hypothetical protein